MPTIRIKPSDDCELSWPAAPSFSTPGAAAFDLSAAISAPICLASGQQRLIPTGWLMEIPPGHVLLVFARSGNAIKRCLSLANGVGVIDPDYRGEVFVTLRNHGAEPQTIEPNERIAQGLLVQLVAPAVTFQVAETLSETYRGAGGFGSTGRR